jgi:hypothetical protein
MYGSETKERDQSGYRPTYYSDPVGHFGVKQKAVPMLRILFGIMFFLGGAWLAYRTSRFNLNVSWLLVSFCFLAVGIGCWFTCEQY